MKLKSLDIFRSNRLLPFGIGLVFTVLLILVLKVDFAKHKIIEEGKPVAAGVQNQILFADIDGDEIDEIITARRRIENGVLHSDFHLVRYKNGYSYSNTIDQVNFTEIFASPSKMFTADYDLNGRDEIYVANLDNDSIFLRCIGYDPASNKYDEDLAPPIFIDICLRHRDVPQINMSLSLVEDINGDGFNEVVFSLSNTFPMYPRKNYIYDVANQSIKKSPTVSFLNNILDIQTINGKPYFVGSSGSTGNYTDTSTLPYTDYYSYKFVYDSELKWNYKPSKQLYYPSSVRSFFMGDNVISLIHAVDTTYLELSDINGNLIIRQPHNLIAPRLEKFNNELILLSENKIWKVLDNLTLGLIIEDLGLLRSGQHILDINNDGLNELIFLNQQEAMLYCFSPTLDDCCSYNFKQAGGDNLVTFTSFVAGDINGFTIHDSQGYGRFLKYIENPYYLLKWPYYILIFISSMVISFLVFGIYKKRIEKANEAEKEIVRLQMLTIKNQMDPHFTLNALTSIQGMYQSENQEKASNYLIQFSRLVHQTLMLSNHIECSLLDELELIRSYCKLEEFEYEQDFNFEIDVDENINVKSTKVPRHILFTYVENAIKHGLRPLNKPKELLISITKQYQELQITIEDNGVGLEGSKRLKTHGTGKGLQIISQILRLFKEINKKEIKINLEDKSPPASGAIATITIPL